MVGTSPDMYTEEGIISWCDPSWDKSMYLKILCPNNMVWQWYRLQLKSNIVIIIYYYAVLNIQSANF